MKRKIPILPAAVLLAAAALTALLLVPSRQSFSGSHIKNPDSYLLDIQRMSGTDTHTLTLDRGDRLQISFRTDRGTLRLTIQAPDGSILYAGNGTAAQDFTLNIPEDGGYLLTVDAHRAGGSLHIRRAAAESSGP